MSTVERAGSTPRGRGVGSEERGGSDHRPGSEERGWTPNVEAVLRDISIRCKEYRSMTSVLAGKEMFKYNCLMYTTIVLGPIAGLLAASGYEDNRAVGVLVTTISFANGVLSTVVKFSKFEQKSIQYKVISSKLASLENNIDVQLSLSEQDRTSAIEYVEWVMKTYNSIYDAMPLLPEKYSRASPEIRVEVDRAKTPLTPLGGYDRNMMAYEIGRLNRG